MTKPLHVYETYVRADIERVWQALVDPEFTSRWFSAQRLESTLEAGAGFRVVGADGDDTVTGTIEEIDPPRRLVMTWRVLYDAAMAGDRPGGWSGCSPVPPTG